MSNEGEIQFQPDESNVFACVKNGSKQVANVATGVFETWNDSNVDTYDIPAAEDGGGGSYYFDFPATIAAGRYTICAYQGALDGSANLLGAEKFIWNGLAEVEDIELALETTVSQVDTADSVFRLTAGSSDNDAYNNMVVSITDVSSGDTRSRRVTDYVGSTKQVTVDYDYEFTIAAGDIVRVWASTYSQTAGAAAASEIADAVWDESQAAHMTIGTTGLKQHHSGGGRYGA